MTPVIIWDKTGKTAHKYIHISQPDETGTAYSTAQANVDPIEAFSVSVPASGSTDSSAVATNLCTGDVIPQLTKVGGIS